MSEYRVLATIDQAAVAQSKVGNDLEFRIVSQTLGLLVDKKDKKPGVRVPASHANHHLANTTAPSVDLKVLVIENDKYPDTGEKSAEIKLDPVEFGHEAGAADAIKSLEAILNKPPIEQTIEVSVTENYGPNPPANKVPATSIFPVHFRFELSPPCKDKLRRRLRGRRFEVEVAKALDALLPTLESDRTVDRAAACQLVMGTANHETKFVSCNQSDGGSATAIVQMQPKTYEDLWDKLYLKKNPQAAEALRRLAGVDRGRPDIALLSSNDAYAAAMAFVHYLDRGAGTKEHPLPGVDKTVDQSRYWGSMYQTGSDVEKMDDYAIEWTYTFGSDSEKEAPPPPVHHHRPKKKVLDHTAGL